MERNNGGRRVISRTPEMEYILATFQPTSGQEHQIQAIKSWIKNTSNNRKS
jgi:hypothetical protein